MEEQNKKKIPEWFLWITIPGIIIIIALFIWILVFLYTNADTLKLMDNACQICQSQQKNFNIDLNSLNP